MPTEATARIKINQMLTDAGWRFFDDENGAANVVLEQNIKITQQDIDAFGADFEKTKNGKTDFTLLDDKGFPFAVLEAKSAKKDPLDGKEQARTYANNLNARFIILSNGNKNYFWDLKRGNNPEIITEFPSYAMLSERAKFTANNKNIASIEVGEDYIALCQESNLHKEPLYINEKTRKQYLWDKGIRIMRKYQVQAIHALQKAAKEGKDRFLFEMATGTGKTLTSAAIIRLFLRSGNAKRVLFLVDRLELENQAWKNFSQYLGNDFRSVIYKQNRDDWQKAEIVVSTVQSFAANDKYRKLFKPTDFDFIIADECHRAIGGNARKVFEFFNGYKLGLTATPKNYLKNIADDLETEDPRAWERRVMLDTYAIFGCENSTPTFSYTLNDGVKDGFLISPTVIDARTEITTDLLSKEGYKVVQENDDGEQEEQIFFKQSFERKFFSHKTNIELCRVFLENALCDPISDEIGKSIIFCVSQKHARKITQLLNELASKIWPDKYSSDFAVQVTSSVDGSQQFTINFANNNLNGRTNFLQEYKSSRTRVCVTVGMMTTGYDCEDILNLAMMRPIFSPTDFVQIKGRGTRKCTFAYEDGDKKNHRADKTTFKLFDFFANCQYFEEEFNYDEEIKLPEPSDGGVGGDPPVPKILDIVEIFSPDALKKLEERAIDKNGMKIDRKLFEHARDEIRQDEEIKQAVDAQQQEKAIELIKEKYQDKPELYLNLDKIRQVKNLDYRPGWWEVLQVIFGIKPDFTSRDAMLNKEFQKFIAQYHPEERYHNNIRNYMKAYIGNEVFRTEINQKKFPDERYTGFSRAEFRSLNGWREKVPQYIKENIPLNQFMD